MTNEPTNFENERLEELLENLPRLPEHTREAVILLIQQIAERYQNYQ